MTGDEPESRLRLDERVALITGANSPIGAAIARFFRGMANTMRQMWMGKENVEMAVDELEAATR